MGRLNLGQLELYLSTRNCYLCTSDKVEEYQEDAPGYAVPVLLMMVHSQMQDSTAVTIELHIIFMYSLRHVPSHHITVMFESLGSCYCNYRIIITVQGQAHATRS